jgi:very-short-patch-repair endonuclease
MYDDVAAAALAEGQFGLLSREQLAALGMDRRAVWRRVDAGKLRKVYPGVFRLTGAAPTWRQQLMGACLWANDAGPDAWPRRATAAVSHRAAAALHGLSGFPEQPLELTAGKQPTFPSPRLLVHRGVADPRFTMLVDGIPVTNVAATLIGLAAVMAPDDAERAVDDALRRYLVTERQLRWAVEEHGGRGRHGPERLRALLACRAPEDGPSASEFQKRLCRLVLGAGLPFVEEYPIPGTPYRADLGSEEYQVGVEGDSARHHSSRADWQHDLKRRNEITATGFALLHFTPTDVDERPGWVLAKIQATLRLRGWPGVPATAGR